MKNTSQCEGDATQALNAEVGRPHGEIRTVTITGVHVTTCCLSPLSPQVLTPSTSVPTPLPPSSLSTPTSPPASPLASSPYSDSSDIDDDVQMLMSQSIAVLPPRPASPASSAGGSMYQSAVSTTSAVQHDLLPDSSIYPGSQTPPGNVQLRCSNSPSWAHTTLGSQFQRRPETGIHEIEDETIISLTSEPIVIRLATPPPTRSSSTQSPALSPSESPQPMPQNSLKSVDRGPQPRTNNEKLRLSVTTGVFACALYARHIRTILDVAGVWIVNSPALPQVGSTGTRESGRSNNNSSILDNFEADLRVRGAVLLLLPASRSMSTLPSLSGFFAHPLVPPKLTRGFVRVHFDNMSASLLTYPAVDGRPTSPSVRRRTSNASSPSIPATTFTMSLTEISVFAFLMTPERTHLESQAGTANLFSSPILIMDPQLPFQYSMQHVYPDLSATASHHPVLPNFEVVDWTDPIHRSPKARLSQWRTKAAQRRHSHAFAQAECSLPSMQPNPPQKASELTSTQGPISTSSAHVASPSPPGRPGIGGLSASPGKSGEPVKRSHSSAIVVKGQMSSGTRNTEDEELEVEVNFEPLHIFVDLGLALGKDRHGSQNETLAFMEEVMPSDAEMLHRECRENISTDDVGQSGRYVLDGEEDIDTPPGTPRAHQTFTILQQERERERERRRLERLVLEDLDLEFDYRPKESEKKSQASPRAQYRRKKHANSKQDRMPMITVKLPMVRLQVRDQSPSSLVPRSSAVVLDVHDLQLSLGGSLGQDRQPATRFSAADTPDNGNPYIIDNIGERRDTPFFSADCRQVVIAYASPGAGKAISFLSLGPVSTDQITRDDIQFGAGTSLDLGETAAPARPHIRLIRPASFSMSTLAVTVNIPSIYVEISKVTLDGLQLWADHLTQTVDSAFNQSVSWEYETEQLPSKNASLIGSRFFAKTRRTGSQASGTESGTGSVIIDKHQGPGSETVVKVCISEAVVRLLLPRPSEGTTASRPFDILAADVDILIELKPEGRDETVLTLSVLDLTVNEINKSGSTTSILCLTTPHNLVSTSRSALKFRFTSLVVPETTSKESRVKLTLYGVTYNMYPDFEWASDLGRFAKAPPGAFESVVPSERTRISVTILNSSVRASAPNYSGALVPYIGELSFSTIIVGSSPEISFHLHLSALSLLLADDISADVEESEQTRAVHPGPDPPGVSFWQRAGYALLAEVVDFDTKFSWIDSSTLADTRVTISQGDIRLHLCADTTTALTAFVADLSTVFSSPSHSQPTPRRRRSEPARLSEASHSSQGLLSSLDEHAFRQLPEVGAAPDMINDDLPTNVDYLDESFGTAAGLRELSDDEFDEFGFDSSEAAQVGRSDHQGVVSSFGGETIRMLRPEGIRMVPNYYDTLLPEPTGGLSNCGDTVTRIRVHNCQVTLFLYDGYDWVRTRRIIEEEKKEIRRRLVKIRQLVASGQTPDPSVEETSTLLFNSVYIGLEHNIDELEPGALIAAIDEELNEDLEGASQSSWQSLKPQSTSSPGKTGKYVRGARRKPLSRSKNPNIEFRLLSLDAEVDRYNSDAPLISRTLITVKDVEILDHIKTSTWKKFLTVLREDSRGNVRETGSNMVRVELRTVHPFPKHPSEEARLRAKILPLRLHVDQDALDFLKNFFSFKDPDSVSVQNSKRSDEIYFQQAEIFPIDLKLDYKPRRVDYRALRDGRTIELMNFFHFDGAEMTLRHVTLTGITGWPRLFDLLNDIWTPDVKATQLVDVVSGVSPIRSVVNVGSGVADLVLLPIAQYKKDGRVVRGLQKGTTAFVKSTAMEAIKLGARLATGTQVILEQAENVIGGQFRDSITAEAIQPSPFAAELGEQLENEDVGDSISRYADQPMNVKEGVQSAYRSLKKNLNSAAQTILAVPMEVYEPSGNEGPMRAVVRAVPIAVLKPMIGASEAVSKTLLGLHNSLDPNIRHENEAKYKQR
ncbi:hypothetical protein AcW1_005680 [Taiwanofungus camphoratus]|nr:hypothetical protein AcW2_004443 [Antrodia cinnamomea]KAI0933107.1 hypothetical protein AcV7_004677 [Antrodia cinnamomea]KAI0934024.1 hypothetical protein AcV5_006006 [Antrodia cinnamomea]KAI0957217.1 hypothetical protein AcW1_005680 [Antrodia cinnamomea]